VKKGENKRKQLKIFKNGQKWAGVPSEGWGCVEDVSKGLKTRQYGQEQVKKVKMVENKLKKSKIGNNSQRWAQIKPGMCSMVWGRHIELENVSIQPTMVENEWKWAKIAKRR
jgi:hypothetical protein